MIEVSYQPESKKKQSKGHREHDVNGPPEKSLAFRGRHYLNWQSLVPPPCLSALNAHPLNRPGERYKQERHDIRQAPDDSKHVVAQIEIPISVHRGANGQYEKGSIDHPPVHAPILSIPPRKKTAHRQTSSRIGWSPNTTRWADCKIFLLQNSDVLGISLGCEQHRVALIALGAQAAQKVFPPPPGGALHKNLVLHNNRKVCTKTSFVILRGIKKALGFERHKSIAP